MSDLLRDYLNKRISRRALLQSVGVAGGLAVLGPTSAFAQNVIYTPGAPGGATTAIESVDDILNIAATAEALAVTALTAAVANATASPAKLTLSALELDIIKAAAAEEQAHYDFLVSAGAKPLTTTFSIPDPKILTDHTTFFSTILAAETIFVAAYMSATREFATMGNGTLAQYAFQIGGVECEHRTLARIALGDDPPNDKAFETPLFSQVSQAAGLLAKLGFLSPTASNAATYTAAIAATARSYGTVGTGVTNLTPTSAATGVAADLLKVCGVSCPGPSSS
jgi:hypothetical protein